MLNRIRKNIQDNYICCGIVHRPTAKQIAFLEDKLAAQVLEDKDEYRLYYATDYNEEINNEIFLKYIPSALFTTANRLMHGWLDEEKIELTIQMYLAMLFPLIKQYKLA